MSSKFEQYRCFGEKALASAKEATCEEEKAELLKIAEAWFELAGEQSEDEINAQSTAPTKPMNVRFWHLADMRCCAA